jgi:uncharacterized protein YjaG (DUF416 family)
MNKITQHRINSLIRQLSPYHQLAFGVLLAERFLPNYFAFYLVEKWGNPMVLLNGIDLLKNVIAEKKYDPDELQLIDNLIEDVTPDMEEFSGNSLASMALDVASMLYECFAFVRSHNPKHIENCSVISFSTLEIYIQKRDGFSYDLSNEELDDRLSKDKLLRSEIDYQLNLLQDLYPTARINHKFYIDKTLTAPNLTFTGFGRVTFTV